MTLSDKLVDKWRFMDIYYTTYVGENYGADLRDIIGEAILCRTDNIFTNRKMRKRISVHFDSRYRKTGKKYPKEILTYTAPRQSDFKNYGFYSAVREYLPSRLTNVAISARLIYLARKKGKFLSLSLVRNFYTSLGYEVVR